MTSCRSMPVIPVILLLTAVLIPPLAIAQNEEEAAVEVEADSDEEALAKAAQNPLASMISLPFQHNFFFDAERYGVDKRAVFRRWLLHKRIAGSIEQIGDTPFDFGKGFRRWAGRAVEKYDRNQYILNIQPVIPVNVGNWNLLNRPILPVISQPIARNEEEYGLGDLNYTLWFSPAEAKAITWGFGPVLVVPTATDDVLGSDKWCAGPSVVVVTMPDPWVIGFLASNVWSFAGQSNAQEVNLFTFQYFVNRNFGNGWYFVSSPLITANWEADSDDCWTLPLGGGMGKIFKLGKQPVNAQLQAFYNLEAPDVAGDWSLRLQFQLMFPKKPKPG